MVTTLEILSLFLRLLKFGTHYEWKRKSTRTLPICLYSQHLAIGNECGLLLRLLCFHNGGQHSVINLFHLHRFIMQMICSGNGLVSYYINLVLDGVGVTRTETKAAINGGLQVLSCKFSYCCSLLSQV